MATYGDVVLTQQGLALYSKAQAGTQLNFTRMQIGGGQLAAGQDPTQLTALITPIAYFAINSVTNSGDVATVKGIFENTNINASTYQCEIGLFATDPTAGEILYAYANAGTQGDTIPPISTGPLSKQFQIDLATGGASNITATIPDGTYIPTTDKGAAGGVATLGSDQKLTPDQLPSSSNTTVVVTNFNADMLDGMHADGIVGQRIVVSNPVSDQYFQIGTLPVSASTTFDKLFIEIKGGPSWDASTLTNDWVLMGNRDTSNVSTSKFTYQYEQTGVDPNNSRANLRVVAYKQSDGSVQVFLRGLAGTSSIGIVAAYGASINGQTNTALPISSPTTNVPAGTLVFDSGNSVAYPPNAAFARGGGTFNGDVLITGKQTVNGPISAGEGSSLAGRDLIPDYDQTITNQDANGNYTTISLNRPDGSLYMKCVLSNPDANLNYLTDTHTTYDASGVNVIKTSVWSITYDANGIPIKKVKVS